MNDPVYHTASAIAAALRVDKKTVHRRAAREAWPARTQHNRQEYAPPPEILTALHHEPVVELEPESQISNLKSQIAPHPRVTFAQLSHAATREAVLAREKAVLEYLKTEHHGKEVALALVAGSHQASTRTVRRWIERYRAFGLDGLVDQKQGRVGRKGTIVPEQFARIGKAAAIEHGSVARAARGLMRRADLPASLREVLHEGHASKSYVTPAVRTALTPAPLTAALAQGPRHARLSSRWTPGDYSQVNSGDVWCSDDMTSNILVWCEWPNAQGWRIGQPQILPVLDVGSLRWLTVRVIMRESGQYTADDIWGLFGDTFDSFGLPKDGFVLEGGHWQSNRVRGARTDLSDEERIGGLTALGLKVHRSYDPRSKIIEGAFNQFQYVLDAFPGYAGRDQRKQLPELVKKQIALCKSGQAHPRQFFPHIREFANHVETSMANLNHERQDGQILRGRSPLEKWGEDNPQLRRVPDESRWLYRSAMTVVKVTCNGLRVTQGSGAKLLAHYYDNPELLVPRQGTKVIVYWNDGNPEADAVILDGVKRRFIGVAQYVKPVGRFTGSDAELEAEARRKQAAMHYARTELRSIQPEMQRKQVPVPADRAAEQIGHEITQASDRALAAGAAKERARRQVARVEVTEEELSAMTTPSRVEEEGSTADEISELFADT